MQWSAKVAAVSASSVLRGVTYMITIHLHLRQRLHDISQVCDHTFVAW